MIPLGSGASAQKAHCPPAETGGQIWSGRRGSNSRPQPWQGCALPAELRPQRRITLVHRHGPPTITARRRRHPPVRRGEPPARPAGSPDPAGPAAATAGRRAGGLHPLPRPMARPVGPDADGEPPLVAHHRPRGHLPPPARRGSASKWSRSPSRPLAGQVVKPAEGPLVSGVRPVAPADGSQRLRRGGPAEAATRRAPVCDTPRHVGGTAERRREAPQKGGQVMPLLPTC